MCHPVPKGRDAETPELARRIRDHSFPHGEGLEPAGPQVVPQVAEELLDASHGGDVEGRLAVDACRACPSIPPDPFPSRDEHGRITDEVVEVIEPTIGGVGGPLVQLGLDLQYPPPGRFRLRPRCVGVHRRPPGIPVPRLRSCCPPSPCGRLSRPRTTTRTPSHPGANGRRRACPPPTWTVGGEGNPRMVPTFTTDRSTGSVPSSSPAASPRLRRRLSSWPSDRPTQDRDEVGRQTAAMHC